MIIHSESARVLSVFFSRKRSQVAIVVIAEKEDNILKFIPVLQSLACLISEIIILHLFIYRDHSRNVVKIISGMLSDKGMLRAYRIFYYFNIVLHGCIFRKELGIVLTAHADSYDIFKRKITKESVLPESCNGFII